jgi:hypothetical protein
MTPEERKKAIEAARKYYSQFPNLARVRIVKSTEDSITLASDFTVETKTVDETEKSIVHLISTPRIDYIRDVMNPFGVDDEPLQKNRGVFYNHRAYGPTDLPIGKNLWLKKKREGVLVKTQYAVEEYAFAGDIFRLAAKDYLNSYSIGWDLATWEWITIDSLLKLINGKFDIVNIKDFDKDDRVMYHAEWGCHEYSQVGVPMNMDATKRAMFRKAMDDGTIATDRGKFLFGELVGRDSISLPDGELEKRVKDAVTSCASPMACELAEIKTLLQALVKDLSIEDPPADPPAAGEEGAPDPPPADPEPAAPEQTQGTETTTAVETAGSPAEEKKVEFDASDLMAKVATGAVSRLKGKIN